MEIDDAKKLTDLPPDITVHAIGEYLTEEDKSTLAVVSKTTQALFQSERLQKMANKLLQQVMHGEQEKAAKILKLHPELLLMAGTATDYSGRMFKTTAFRYALWAMDILYMCNMMLDYLPDSPQGVDIQQCLLTQFKEQLQYGLDYTLNGRTINEVHYDFSPIIAALQTYSNEFDNWYAADNWDAMTDHWCKVVGLAQRDFPANVAQHYYISLQQHSDLIQTDLFMHHDLCGIHATLTSFYFDDVILVGYFQFTATERYTFCDRINKRRYTDFFISSV